MMHDEPKPKSTAVLRGDQRTLQYYALRTGWEWTLSGKTRSTTEAMQAAWGDELDIVTMLGAEPKPVKRSWRRYEEHRELVDAGRNLKVAKLIRDQLAAESLVERNLRDLADQLLLDEIEEEFVEILARYDTYQGILVSALQKDVGPLRAANKFNHLVLLHYQKRWVKPLKYELDEERERPEGQLLARMLKQRDRIHQNLVNGKWERHIDDIGDACHALGTKCAREWLDRLAHWTRRYREWTLAKETLAKRKVTDVAAKLKKLGALGKLG